MRAYLMAALEAKIQQWLDENADELGGTYGTWQDNTTKQSTAAVIAAGAAAVYMGMAHQSELEDKAHLGG